MRNLMLAAAIAAAAGCKHAVVRNAATYQAELDQYHMWSVAQAAHLRTLVIAHCECASGDGGGAYVTDECANAANLVLVVGARADWHKAMAEYNAGLTDKAPAPQPPAIPELACPLFEED